MSLFTQWVPCTWATAAAGRARGLRRPGGRRVDEVAPGFKESILARQVIGPYDMEQEWGLIGGNIFLGELGEPAVPHAPGARLRRLPHADAAASTSARAPRTAAAASPASRPTPVSARSARTAGGVGGGVDAEPYSFTFYVASWYRKSPYWQRTVEAGCTSWDLYNHMLIPTPVRRRRGRVPAPLEHVTLWDVAVERQVEIARPRRVRSCSRRDLSRCQVMQCKYAPIVAPHGGVVNDPILVRLGENHFWLSLADSDAPCTAWGCRRSPAWTSGSASRT